MTTIPTLIDVCVQVASQHRHYTVQRRFLERLPDHAANRLLALLLAQRGPNALRPTHLELFRHCVTCVALTGRDVSAEWLVALAGFAYLEELQLQDCPRLDAAALAPLAAGPCAASLRRLQVAGCGKLADGVLPYIGQLTGLRSLSLSDTGMQGAGSSLDALSTLSGLTRLQAGGLQAATDASLCGLLPHLPLLEQLELWGAGNAGGEELLLVLATCLPALTRLSMAWSAVTALPALPGLQELDLSHCRLGEVWWPAGEGSCTALRRLVLRGATLGGSAAGEAAGLAALIRAAAGSLQEVDLSEMRWDGDTGRGPGLGAQGGSGGGGVGPWAPVLGALGCCPCLTHLDLSRTGVRPEHLALLEGATSLRRLQLSYSRAGGSVEGAVALASTVPELQSLDLCGCGVTDACVPWLQQLTCLTSLDLSDNEALTLAPQQRQQRQQQQQEAHAGAAAAAAIPALVAAPDQGDGAWEAPAPVDVWAPAPAAPALAPHHAVPRAQPAGEMPGSSAPGCTWPLLQHLKALKTRVGEAGLRALCGGGAAGARGASGHGGAGGGSGGAEAAAGGDDGQGGVGGVGRGCRLEELRLGGSGATDAALAVAAKGMPCLRSLTIESAPCTPHGLERLAAAPSLQCLTVGGCWLVPDMGDEKQLLAKALRHVPDLSINGWRPNSVGSSGAAEEHGTGSESAGGGRGQGRAGVGQGGSRRAGGQGLGGEDLARWDQRVRYGREELLQLAKSPLVCGAGDGAGAGEVGDGAGGVAALMDALPAELRASGQAERW